MIEVLRKDSICHIRLNRPKALHSLNLEMTRELSVVLKEIATDRMVKAVFLDSSSEKAFCAGGDVKLIAEQKNDADREAVACELFRFEYLCDYMLHTLPQPVICWASGITMGGGMGLAMGSSHRIVTETSLWAMPEVSIGFYPDVGASWFLNRIPTYLGRFLALTGARLDPSDILFLGWASAAMSSDNKDTVIDQLEKLPFTESSESNHRTVSKFLSNCHPLEKEVSSLETHRDDIYRLFHSRSIDEIIEQSQKNTQPGWLGESLARLLQGSPSSLHIIDRQLARARQLSLKDCFQLEYQLSLQLVARNDFYEGVRALLIEKDNQPRWQPARGEQVTEEWIRGHFVEKFPRLFPPEGSE